ncbi:MAG: fumarylacetoacetate hydrolase family protein [Pseudomonadota bacterium]
MRLANLRAVGPHVAGQTRLVQVSADHTTCRATHAPSLQAALDEGGLSAKGPEETFDIRDCAAPLPRAFGFLDGSAYLNHVELVRRARGADMPERLHHDPLMYQGCSVFDDPTAPITADASWGADCEAEIAVITSAVPRGVSTEEAASHVALVMLINDVSFRHLIADELAKGFGFVQSKPASACSPLAISPDDLPGWDGRKLHGTLCVDINKRPLGRLQTGQDMAFDFGNLIAHAAKTRDLPAGTVIGSGTISNREPDGGPGKTVIQGGAGYACIIEQRMVETRATGTPVTPFLEHGDRVKIWMEDATGQPIFGAIDQRVAALT